MTEQLIEVTVLEDDVVLRQEALQSIEDDLLGQGVAVRAVRDEAGPGSKSGLGAIITSLAVSGGLAASARAVQQVVVAYLRRAGARKVQLKVGKDTIVLDGASPREQRAALEAWINEHRPVEGGSSGPEPD